MPQANPAAGEVGVSVGAEDYVFRPSFLAMASMGSPSELPAIYADSHQINNQGFRASLKALHACCNRTPDKAVGFYKGVNNRLRYVAGAIPLHDVRVLGAKLLYNGMIGAHVKGSGGSGVAIFDPAEYVGAAVAHLGMSFEEAWRMTMVEFQLAMKAKFPDADKKDYPTAEEHQAMIDRIEGANRGN